MPNRFFLLALLTIPLLVHALPPSGDRLESVVESGLTREPVRKALSTLSTTVLDAIDTDITDKTDSNTQLYVVTNFDDTTDVCFGTIPRSTSQTCNETLCQTATKWTDAVPDGNGMAATMNCTHGDASIGSPVPKGQSRAFRYAGSRCGCIVASGAGTDVVVERVSR